MIDTVSDLHEEQKRLGDIVKDSVEKNRQFFVVYLGLLVYVLLMVVSTTDQQLLVPSQGIKLPLVDATLPLIAFYFVAPLFLLAIHFNLLQNLESHHYKLMRWQDTYPGKIVPREEIQAFLFDHKWLDQGGPMKWWVGMAYGLFIHSGPFAIGVLLWRFTDYQGIGITSWHLFLFAIDNYLVWLTKKSFRKNIGGFKDEDVSLKERRKLIRRWEYFAKCLWCLSRPTWGNIFNALFIFMVLCQFAIACYFQTAQFDGTTLWKYRNKLESVSGSGFASLFLPIISVSSDELFLVENNERKAARSFTDEQMQYAKFLDLSYRHLRGLSLRGVYLTNVDFKYSYLEDADLSSANLMGSNFFGTHLEGANLQLAIFINSSMIGVELQKANLSWAQLQGVNMQEAQLQGADLFYAQLEGASLFGANFNKAKLGYTNLQGTLFLYPIVRDTDIPGSLKSGAATFDGAFAFDNGLSPVQMESSDLNTQQLLGAIVNPADLLNSHIYVPQEVTYAEPTAKKVNNLLDKPDAVWNELVPSWDRSIELYPEAKIAAAKGLKKNYESRFGLKGMSKNPEYIHKLNQAFCASKNFKSFGENCSATASK